MERKIEASRKTKIIPIPGTHGRAGAFEQTDQGVKERLDEIKSKREKRKQKRRDEYQKNKGKK